MKPWEVGDMVSAMGRFGVVTDASLDMFGERVVTVTFFDSPEMRDAYIAEVEHPLRRLVRTSDYSLA